MKLSEYIKGFVSILAEDGDFEVDYIYDERGTVRVDDKNGQEHCGY